MSSMIQAGADLTRDLRVTSGADGYQCLPALQSSTSGAVSFTDGTAKATPGHNCVALSFSENGNLRESGMSVIIHDGLQRDGFSALDFSPSRILMRRARGKHEEGSPADEPGFLTENDAGGYQKATEGPKLGKPHAFDSSLEIENQRAAIPRGNMPCKQTWNPSPETSMFLDAGSPKPRSDRRSVSLSREILPQSAFLNLAEQNPRERAAKRIKLHGDNCNEGVNSTIKKVSEIVLVLAGLGQMRAGRSPTSVEKALQAEAYGRLGFLVQRLAPDELVSKESVENLIEELGLRITEERKDEVPPSPSVATSVSEEIEEAEQREAAGVTFAPVTQIIYNTLESEDNVSEVSSKSVLTVPGSQLMQMSQPVSSLAPVLALPYHGLPANTKGSTSSLPPNIFPTEELLPSSLLNRNLTMAGSVILAQRDEAQVPQKDLTNTQHQENHSNVKEHDSFSYSTNVLHPESASISAAQRQAEGTGMRFTHKQLTQVMQHWIQPTLLARQSLKAVYPRHFMNLPVPCELCKVILKDTGSVVMCDRCEKAFHVRCLQPYQLKGIPKGDWYCPKCMIETQGRLQIPKYGPINQGSAASLSFSRGAGSLQAFERGSSVKSQAQVGLTQRIISTTNGPSGATGKIFIDNLDRQLGKKGNFRDVVQGTSDDYGRLDKPSQAHMKSMMDGRSRTFDTSQHEGGSFTALLGSFTQAEAQQHLSAVVGAQPPIQPPIQRPSDIQASDNSAHFRSQFEGQSNVNLQSLPFSRSQLTRGIDNVGKVGEDGLQIRHPMESIDPSRTQPGKASGQFGVQADLKTPGISTVSGQPRPATLVGLNAGVAKLLEQGDSNRVGQDTDHFGVEWVGDVVQKYEGKFFYSACCVGGFWYKLQDYALFRPETQGIPPYIARIQALWEDTATGSKWVRVNWCYYPTDIPLMVGRPSSPEANEVYESNHGDNNLVGSIQGPCLVLRPESYFKEIERRRGLLRSGHTSEGLFPIFLCRWLYDAPKGVFRPAIDGPAMM